MEKEIFKPIQDNSLFGISNAGNVKSLKSGKLMKLWRTSKGPGYSMYVNLPKRNGEVLYVSIAKCVADHFIRKTKNNEKVTNFDGDAKNNHVNNLRIIPRYDNTFFKKNVAIKKIKEVCNEITASKNGDQISISEELKQIAIIYLKLCEASKIKDGQRKRGPKFKNTDEKSIGNRVRMKKYRARIKKAAYTL